MRGTVGQSHVMKAPTAVNGRRNLRTPWSRSWKRGKLDQRKPAKTDARNTKPNAPETPRLDKALWTVHASAAIQSRSEVTAVVVKRNAGVIEF